MSWCEANLGAELSPVGPALAPQQPCFEHRRHRPQRDKRSKKRCDCICLNRRSKDLTGGSSDSKEARDGTVAKG